MRVSKFVVLLLAVVCAFGVAAPVAQAADSTCSNHSNNLTGWMISTDHIDTHWHFQCGGANNEDFYIVQVLQRKNSSGVWEDAACTNGYLGFCSSFKPASGWFNGGSDQSGDSGWNPWQPPDIECKYWRMHTTVHFRGSSPDLTYNGIVQWISNAAGTC